MTHQIIHLLPGAPEGFKAMGAPCFSSTSFPDGEVRHILTADDTEAEVIIAGPLHTDHNYIETVDIANAVLDTKLGGRALKVTILATYFGYATMAEKKHPGEVVKACVRARLLSLIQPTNIGNEIRILDIHEDAIFADFGPSLRPIHARARPILVDALKQVISVDDNLMVSSADDGRVPWVIDYANAVGCSNPAIITKTRLANGETRLNSFSGDVAGRNVVLVDDMVRQGSTMVKGIRKVRTAGAASVVVVCPHAPLTADDPMLVIRALKDAGASKVIFTDSHPTAVAVAREAGGFVKVVSCVPAMTGGLV